MIMWFKKKKEQQQAMNKTIQEAKTYFNNEWPVSNGTHILALNNGHFICVTDIGDNKFRPSSFPIEYYFVIKIGVCELVCSKEEFLKSC